MRLSDCKPREPPLTTTTSISPCPVSGASNVAAAAFLAARRLLRQYDLPLPSAGEVMAATGAGRSRAYELAERLLGTLPELARPPGRPASPPPEASPRSDVAAIAFAVRDYLMDHPGCVSPGKRRRYSDGFRHFGIDLRERFADLELEGFANASGIPSRTLAEWLRTAPLPSEAKVSEQIAPPPRMAATDPHIQTVLAAWASWHGGFSRFCNHVRHELRIPYGRTMVANILATHGVRIPERRPGRSPDEKASRTSFVTFFPGAQWVGDGMQVPFFFNGERFNFNFELDVDAHTAALVGGFVSDHEDASAVVGTYDDGVCTTAARPLSLLLDNRESNHTAEVDAAIGDALLIRSTPARGQSKSHVEGAFGLFSQTAPPLEVNAATARGIAKQALTLVVKTWARTLNHKPRNDRASHGRSRIDIYREEKPSDEQIAAAKSALEARQKMQEKVFQTRLAREDPTKRILLEKHFDRLELADPNGNTKSAIARYPLDAILDGIAIFEAKRAVNTLPDDLSSNARYLLGIVSNRAHDDEDRHLIEALIRLRQEARDQLIMPLEAAKTRIARDCLDPRARILRFVECVIDSDRQIDRLFWLAATSGVVADQPEAGQSDLFRTAAGRIRTAYRMPHRRRQKAILYLAQACPCLRCK